MRRELREIKGDQQAYASYVDGLHKLMGSGVLNVLRALGRPTRYNLGKDLNVLSSEASWSAGWNDCLDALLHFKEMYLDDEPEVSQNNPADFGAVQLAQDKGDLTKEEADARKQRGNYTKPDISAYTGNLPKPTPRS